MAVSEPRADYQDSGRPIADEVADHVGIRRDIVEEVIRGYHDVLVERAINRRKIIIPRILTLRAISAAPNGIRKEKHLQLRAKVSSELKSLMRFSESKAEVSVDRNNWREKLQSIKKTKRKPDYRDFLIDDEDDD